jgi:hypothetical protein
MIRLFRQGANPRTRGARVAMRPARWGPVGLAFLLALSCTTDRGVELPSGPVCPLSGIAGRVEVAGQGVPASLTVESSDSSGPAIHFSANSDSSGQFAFPLAAGRYRLHMNSGQTPPAFWSQGAPVGNYDSTGTVVVEEGKVTRTDFAFGAVVVHLTFSSQVDVEHAFLHLRSRPDGPRSRQSSFYERIVEPGEVTMRSRGLPAGAYSVVWQPRAPYILDLLLPGVLDPRLADSVVVRAGAATEYTCAPSYPTSRIRGRVRGSWERSAEISGPWLAFFTEDSLTAGTVGVDLAGYFRADVPCANRVKVAVTIGDVRRWIGGAEFGEATSFALDPGSETEIPDYTESGLFLRLVPPDPWMSVAANCALLDEQDREIRVTNEDAARDQFLISNLTPGRYRLLVTPRSAGAEDWLPQWYDRAAAAGSARLVDIPPDGGIGRVVVQLERGGEIRGTVRSGAGAPVSGRSVKITPADTTRAWATRSSGGAEGFRFRGIPDGDWKVGVSLDKKPYAVAMRAADDGWIWYGGASFDSAAVIVIRDHAVVDGIEIRLP